MAWSTYAHDITDRLAKRDNTNTYPNFKDFCGRQVIDLVGIADKDIKRLAFVQKDIQGSIYNLFGLETHASGYRQGRKLALQMATKARQATGKLFMEMKYLEQKLRSNKVTAADFGLFIGKGFPGEVGGYSNNDLTEEELLQIILQTEHFEPGTTFTISNTARKAQGNDVEGWIPPPGFGNQAKQDEEAVLSAIQDTIASSPPPKKRKRKRKKTLVHDGPEANLAMDVDSLSMPHLVPLGTHQEDIMDTRDYRDIGIGGETQAMLEEKGYEPNYEAMNAMADFRLGRKLRSGIDYDRELNLPMLHPQFPQLRGWNARPRQYDPYTGFDPPMGMPSFNSISFNTQGHADSLAELKEIMDDSQVAAHLHRLDATTGVDFYSNLLQEAEDDRRASINLAPAVRIYRNPVLHMPRYSQEELDSRPPAVVARPALVDLLNRPQPQYERQGEVIRRLNEEQEEVGNRPIWNSDDESTSADYT